MTTASTSDPSQQPKSLGDRILGLLPIVLTVLSTLLAGLSSSEMTQAQYHRSLAAQYQSKVGDQWNFFQAKRQRGVILIGQLDALRAELAGSGERDYFQAASRLVEDLRHAAIRTFRLNFTIKSLPDEERFKSLKWAANQLRERVDQEAHNTVEMRKQLFKLAPREKVLAELRDERLKDPRPALAEKLTAVGPALPAVLAAIERHESEPEIAARLAEVSPNQLTEAIDRVEMLAAELDAETCDTVKQLEQVNEVVLEQVDRVKIAFTLTRTLERALEELADNEKGEKDAADLRPAIDHALRLLRWASVGTAELIRCAQLARNEFNERRYECEARYYQVIAWLYEAQIRKSSQIADTHRQRSYLFFYAMLVAQAGVILGTFALTVRQLSALWAAASLAGVMAMAAGVYVYFFI